MRNIRLDARTVPTLTLPDDKTETFFWDDALPRFALRLRRSGDRILRSFVCQYRRGAVSLRSTIGSADVLKPEQARAAAKKLLAKVELGEDPQGDRNERRLKDQTTFRAVAAEYLESKRDELRPTTFRGSKAYLTGPYFKPLHSLPVDRIVRRDIAALLVVIARENGKPTAAHARSKLSALFSWAMKQGYLDANPCIGTEQPKANPARDRILSDSELAAIWNACDDDSDFSKIIRLLILLPCRRQEIGGLLRREVDLEAGTLTISAERSKNHRSITYPLLPMALDIIASVPQLVSRDQLFGSQHPRGFSSWYRGKVKLDAKLDIAAWNVHDLRRSVATRLADLGILPHIIEQLLNHASGHKAGVSGIYNKSVYAAETKRALGLWEDHVRALISGGERTVIAMLA
jgi:integrase